MSQANRDEKGRLLPGSTANPSGRPKLVREYQDWIRENAWEQAKAALLACLADPDGRIRMMAVKEINDRLLGKPTQSVANEDGTPLSVGIVMLPAETDK